MRTLRAKILSPDRRRRSDGVTSQWPSAGSRRAARRSPAGKSRRPDTTHAPKIIGPAGSSNAISCVIGDARHIGWEGLDASILREQAAVTVPGSAFGAQGEGYLRLTCVRSWDELRTGIDRDRKSGGEGKGVSVSVDLGGRRKF